MSTIVVARVVVGYWAGTYGNTTWCYFQIDFKFVDHVDATLKVYSQRLFQLKQLCDQGILVGICILSFRQ